MEYTGESLLVVVPGIWPLPLGVAFNYLKFILRETMLLICRTESLVSAKQVRTVLYTRKVNENT